MTQETALEILKSGDNVFLTGEPGSGKTHTVNAYVRYLRDHGIYPAITASTGIAATHLNGVTIHSWSGIGIRTTLAQLDLDRLADNERLTRRIRDTHVLIIDEISMLDAVCCAIRECAEPFGGLQVVMVGDFYQLPPVSHPNEPPPRFAFTADSWKRANLRVCYLTEQHRQSDIVLSKLLGDIRSGIVTEQTTTHLARRRFSSPDTITVPTKLYTHKIDVDRQNNEKLSQLPDETHTYRMTKKGPKVLVGQLVNGCLSPETLELKLGAAVMCTRNNQELGFVNGTLGTVVDFDEEQGYPIIETQHGYMVKVSPMDWSIEDGEKTRAQIIQIPLRLAWAMTVHKSQGMSLDAAILDLTKSFDYGQGYVALSRVRTLEGLFLLGWNHRALQTDPAIQLFDHALREQSKSAEHVWQSLPEPEREIRQKDFIRTCGGKTHPINRRRIKSGSASSRVYTERLAHIREKHPQAYTSWTHADDEKLTKLYQDGVKVKELVEQFQRQPGAIRSRLKHLGIV